jgi:S1-C subfamily serine protease
MTIREAKAVHYHRAWIAAALLLGAGVTGVARADAERTREGANTEIGLQPGDVINVVNRTSIESVEALRQAIQPLQPGDPVVIQVERQGRLTYLAFEIE